MKNALIRLLAVALVVLSVLPIPLCVGPAVLAALGTAWFQFVSGRHWLDTDEVLVWGAFWSVRLTQNLLDRPFFQRAM